MEGLIKRIQGSYKHSKVNVEYPLRKLLFTKKRWQITQHLKQRAASFSPDISIVSNQWMKTLIVRKNREILPTKYKTIKNVSILKISDNYKEREAMKIMTWLTNYMCAIRIRDPCIKHVRSK